MPAATAAAATVVLHTLGECRITVHLPDRAATLTPASDRLFTLALLLAAEPGRPLPRARAAAWLWPDLPAPAARHALRQLVYRLRQLGVPLDSNPADLTLLAQHVGSPDAVQPDAPPRLGRCLPNWDAPSGALADWADRYRAQTEAAARTRLARALEAAPATYGDRARLAAALLDLDPHHPLARAALPRPACVRETPRTPDTLPCIGRDGVLATLRAYANDALAGHAPALALAAPPGVGATRVLLEFSALARPLGFATLPLGAPGTHDFTAALAAAIRALLERPGSLGCTAHALRTLRRFVASPPLPAGDVPLRRLGAAIAELARTVAAERPLLLTVDARCTTAPERALAAAIARDLTGSAALTLFLAPALGTADPPLPRNAFHLVPLSPLDPADATRLAAAAARASAHTLRRDDLTWCVRTARGRPGDLIALATACAHHPGTRELPATVAARFRDALTIVPQRARDLATLHAQLGDHATPDALAQALGRRRPAVDAALRTLERAGLPPLAPPTAPPPHRRAATRAFNLAVRAAL